MIARLRRRHRVAALGLWLLVPSVLWFGSARTEAPRMDAMPAALQKSSAGPGSESWRVADASVGIRIAREADALWIDPGALPRRPDLLVYWLQAEPPDGDGVPANARLAGRLDGDRPIALDVPTRAGGLLFFSLGHQERVHWLPLEHGDE